MTRAPDVRACRRLFELLDWDALGDVYCDSGGRAFWDAHREPVLRCGAEWVGALLRRLDGRHGTSLYVGAGVAELPVMLAESVVAGRKVVAVNRRGAECDLLEQGLRAAGIEPERLRIECGDAADHLDRGPFDHVSMVSVLSDPESWPVTSGVTYGTVPPVLLDVDAFVAERRAITAFVAAVGDALAPRALIATTVEEVAWFYAWRDAVGAEVDVDDEVFETAVVGDPMGFLEVSKS